MTATIIYYAVSLVIGLALAWAFAAAHIWSAKRRLALSRARLRLARCVTRMEEVLLAGGTTSGQICHDEIFKLMQLVQRLDKYPLGWYRFLAKPSPREKQFIHRLMEELRRGPPEITSILSEYVAAYRLAYVTTRPLAGFLYRAYVKTRIMGIRLRDHKDPARKKRRETRIRRKYDTMIASKPMKMAHA